MRRATPQDQELLLAYCRQDRHSDSPATGVTAARRLEWFRAGYQEWQKLCSQSDVSIWVDEENQDYLVARHGQKESLTGQRQTVVWDWGRNPALFLEALRQKAGEVQDEYLVAQVFEGAPNPFEDLGFCPELRRVISPTRGTRAGLDAVRTAQPKDLLFISSLHSQSGHAYLPPHRQVNQEAVLARSLNAYMSLDLGGNVLGYLIYDGRRPVGYILYKLPYRLEVTEARAAYLYDVNLRPEYWGKSLGRVLGLHSLHELNQLGYEFVVGDISATNERSYQAAIRSGHFTWESTRWALAA